MTSTDRNDAAVALMIHGEAYERRRTEMEQYHGLGPLGDSDDDTDSDCPIVDTFYNAGGAGSICLMIKFTPIEFTRVWDKSSSFALKYWNEGRGRWSKYCGKNIFFAAPTVAKQDFLEHAFKINGPTFEILIIVFMTKVNKHVFDMSVIDVGQN